MGVITKRSPQHWAAHRVEPQGSFWPQAAGHSDMSLLLSSEAGYHVAMLWDHLLNKKGFQRLFHTQGEVVWRVTKSNCLCSASAP